MSREKGNDFPLLLRPRDGRPRWLSFHPTCHQFRSLVSPRERSTAFILSVRSEDLDFLRRVRGRPDRFKDHPVGVAHLVLQNFTHLRLEEWRDSGNDSRFVLKGG